MVRYTVLRRLDDGTLNVMGDFDAPYAEKAIKQAAAEPGRYVAIPHRSWTEMEAQPEVHEPRLALTPVPA